MKNSRMLPIVLSLAGIFFQANELVAIKLKIKTSEDKEITKARRVAFRLRDMLVGDEKGNYKDKDGNACKALSGRVDTVEKRFATYETQQSLNAALEQWQAQPNNPAEVASVIVNLDAKVSSMPALIIAEADIDAKIAEREKLVKDPRIVALQEKIAALKALVSPSNADN